MDAENKNTQRGVNDQLLVAYLTVAGFKQSSLPVLAEDKFLSFRYERTPELEDAIEKFYLRQTSVDALTVLEAYRTVKAWGYEVKRTRKGGGVHGTN